MEKEAWTTDTREVTVTVREILLQFGIDIGEAEVEFGADDIVAETDIAPDALITFRLTTTQVHGEV